MRFSSLHRVLAIVSAALVAGGCHAGYYVRSGYEQTRILLLREPISEVLQEDSLPADEIAKLRLALEARAFARSMGLSPGGAYEDYVPLGRDVLAWVVIGCRDDAFEPHLWWFPFVGTVPYKGFFERADADGEAEALAEGGYEVSVRPTSALSTLGWFDDPVLSTMLQFSEVELVNTLIHEIAHRTVWIPNHVDFNESFANYVGLRGAEQFFHAHLEKCQASDTNPTLCSSEAASLAERARSAVAREFEIADAVTSLYTELDTLYRSARPRDEKLAERQVIFERIAAPLRSRYPTLRALKSVHNAELLQLKLYLTGIRDFDGLFARSNGTWDKFLSHIRSIRDQLEASPERDPFELLRSE